MKAKLGLSKGFIEKKMSLVTRVEKSCIAKFMRKNTDSHIRGRTKAIRQRIIIALYICSLNKPDQTPLVGDCYPCCIRLNLPETKDPISDWMGQGGLAAARHTSSANIGKL